MQETENIAGERNQEIVAKVPITQAEIEQIRKIYKLDFPCPHCKERINDDHFDEEQRAFQLIDEKLKENIEITTSIEDCIKSIEEYFKVGFTKVHVHSTSPNEIEFIREFGKKVLPYFQEQTKKNG